MQNLEYFYSKEALHLHVRENPCLTEGWSLLWPRLCAAGWARVEETLVGGSKVVGAQGVKTAVGKSSNGAAAAAAPVATVGNTVCFTLNFAANYLSTNDSKKSNNINSIGAGAGAGAATGTLQAELSKGQVPGVHIFVSRAALTQYAARFPYLLQDEEQFMQTLGRYQWETRVVKASMSNRGVVADTVQMKWSNAAALRESDALLCNASFPAAAGCETEW